MEAKSPSRTDGRPRLLVLLLRSWLNGRAAVLAADCRFGPRKSIRHDVSFWPVAPNDAVLRAPLGARGRESVEALRLRRTLPLNARHFRMAIPSTGNDPIDAVATRLDIYVVGLLLGAIAGAMLLEPRFGLTGIAFAILLSTMGRALCRRLLLRRFHAVAIPFSYWFGPLTTAAAGLAVAEAILRVSGGHGFAIAIPAALAGFAIYGLALLAWVRTSCESLIPQGFISGEGRGAVEAPVA